MLIAGKEMYVHQHTCTIHISHLLFIFTSRAGKSPQGVRKMDMKNANIWDAMQAFILIEKNYQKKGYLSCKSIWDRIAVVIRFCLFINKAILAPLGGKSVVLVVKQGKKVIGTVSICFNRKKLCIDKLFPKKLKQLREESRSFAYFGSFAISETHSCTRLSVKMLRDMTSFLKGLRIEKGVCVVHPHHVRLYERMGFELVDESKNMSGLKKAPASLLFINVNDASI